jgi:hypothetical protein
MWHISNGLEESGGPFAAGEFEYDTGRLVAVAPVMQG